MKLTVELLHVTVYFSKMKFHIVYIFCAIAVKSAVFGNSPK
ncbi:unnamed protein product, partial [Allacma fusca]